MTPLWSINIPDVFGLAECLYSLALDHDLKWAKFWAEKWSDFTWVRRAMKATYDVLTPEEKSLLEPEYSQFIEMDKVCDWNEMVKNRKTAICNILDGEGLVVKNEGVPVRVTVDIDAQDASCVEEILKKQSKRFIEWF